MALEDDLKEVIASFTTDQSEVEIVRISHSEIDTLYLSEKLGNYSALIDENGQEQSITYVPMALSDESSGELLLNERTLSLQGINDLVASEEDKIPVYDDGEREYVKVDVLTYMADYDGNLSQIAQGPFSYFLQKTVYSSKSNSCTMTISTTPTNNDTTGDTFTEINYATMAGFN